MPTIYENFLDAIQHKETHPVPVVGWDNAVPITRLAGILAKDYYRNPEVKMMIQKQVLDEFAPIRWVPGFHADYGVVIEPSAFGCRIKWFEDDSPYAYPLLETLDRVDRLRPPDPHQDGLMPEALDQYRYMWQHINPRYIHEYGYLRGFALTLGPLETAASLRGYGNLMLDLYDHPQEIKKLLEIITEGLLRWLRAQQEVNGELSFLILVDHVPGNISLAAAREFAFPYFKVIFDEFPGAIHLYHNEGRSDHYLPEIPEFGAHVFHCGKVTLAKAKSQIGDRVCLMGNLDANEILLPGTPEVVKNQCREKLQIAAHGGGYLLCTGGAMAPGTPRKNIWAMVEASLEFEHERRNNKPTQGGVNNVH